MIRRELDVHPLVTCSALQFVHRTLCSSLIYRLDPISNWDISCRTIPTVCLPQISVLDSLDYRRSFDFVLVNLSFAVSRVHCYRWDYSMKLIHRTSSVQHHDLWYPVSVVVDEYRWHLCVAEEAQTVFTHVKIEDSNAVQSYRQWSRSAPLAMVESVGGTTEQPSWLKKKLNFARSYFSSFSVDLFVKRTILWFSFFSLS